MATVTKNAVVSYTLELTEAEAIELSVTLGELVPRVGFNRSGDIYQALFSAGLDANDFNY